jgi:hypothetical protein
LFSLVVIDISLSSCLVDLAVFEDTDALTGITNNIHNLHH